MARRGPPLVGDAEGSPDARSWCLPSFYIGDGPATWMRLVQFKDDVGVEETVGFEDVVAEDENAGAGCISKLPRAVHDLERGLDCDDRIVVGEVEHARRGMAVYRAK